MRFLGTDIERDADSASAFSDLAPTGQVDLSATNPAAPSAPVARLFREEIAGRQFATVLGPIGRKSNLQPLIARNKVGIWCPQGNSVTVPGSFGFTNFISSGTITARVVTATSVLGRMRRIGWVSSAVAGSMAFARVGVSQVSTGDTIGGVAVGGFFKVIRFGIADAAPVAGARMFVGMSLGLASPTNVEPATLTNIIGIGHGANDTSLQFYAAGDTAQPPVSLGTGYPATAGSVYELALFCPAGSLDIRWQVTRLDAANTSVSGLVTGVSGVTVPAPSTLLSYSHNWRCNNATALAVAMDICSDYIETEQ